VTRYGKRTRIGALAATAVATVTAAN